MKPKPDERISLHGLTPEEVLRALLAVNPDDPPADEDEEGDERKV